MSGTRRRVCSRTAAASAFGLVALALLVAGPSTGGFATASPPASPRAELGHAAAGVPGIGPMRSGARPPMFYPTSVWTNVTTAPKVTGPSARYGGAMAYDAAAGYSVFFGGGEIFGAIDANDTWAWESGAWVNISKSSGGHIIGAPPARLFPAMTYDPATDQVLMYGGYTRDSAGAGAYLTDTWAFANGTWTNLTGSVGTPPPGRWAPSMAYDPVLNGTILFGGGIGGLPSGVASISQQSTWELVGGRWKNLTGSLGANQPPPTDAAAMAYDPGLGAIVLFGGVMPNGNLQNDTWIYRSGGWTNISNLTPNPPIGTPWGAEEGLAGAVLVPDEADGTMVLFGGTDIEGQIFVEGSNETYLLVNETWMNVSAFAGVEPEGAYAPYDNPNGPYGVAGDWDNATGGIVVFGGLMVYTNHSAGPSNNTWVYDWANVSATLSANESQIPVGTPVTLSTTAHGGTWRYNYSYVGLPPGCSSENAANFTCTPSAVGTYDVTVYANDSHQPVPRTGIGTLLLTVFPPLAPTLSISPSIVDLGNPVEVNVTIVGGSSGPASFAYSGLPDGCLSLNLSDFACTPAAIGNYSVSARVLDSVRDLATIGPVGLEVLPRLFASINVSAPAVESGTPITLTASAGGGSGPGSYTYAYTDLPDGCVSANTSTITCTPSVTTATTFRVQLSVTDGTHEPVTAAVSVIVWPALAASIDATPSGGTAPLAVNLQANVTGGDPPYTYAWTIVDPTGVVLHFVNETSVRATWPSAGAYTVYLWANDSFGAAAEAVTNVSVAPSPEALSVALTTDPEVGVVDLGEVLHVSAASVGGSPGPSGYTYAWTLPAGCTSNGANASCTPTATGSLTLDVHVLDAAGNAGSASTTVVVKPALTMVLNQSVSAACGAGVENLSATVSGGLAPYTIAWSFPGGAEAAGTSVGFYAPGPGNFTVSANLTDGTGASRSASLYVDVAACAASSGPPTVPIVIGVALTLAVVAAIAAVIYTRRPRAPAAPP